MDGLTIVPIQWARLPDLGDVHDIDEGDLACMADVQAVLARHGKLKRFAIHLAHRHFEMMNGEILIERQESGARAQTISVARLDEALDARPTTWLFDDLPILNLNSAIYCACVPDPTGTHACVRHGKSRSPGERHEREDATKGRRISEEKSRYEQGFPVGGHDRHDTGRGRGR